MSCRRLRSVGRGAECTLGLVLAGCVELHPLPKVPVLGGTPEARAVVLEELSVFDQWVGPGRLRLSSVEFTDLHDRWAGRVSRGTNHVKLEAELALSDIHPRALRLILLTSRSRHVIRPAEEDIVPGPHPMALRERVIEAYNNGEGTYDELAERFRVGRASVDRWIGLAKRTGSVEPKPMGGARHERKVDGEGEDFVREFLEQMPDSTQPELVAAYEEEFKVRMHRSTMGRSVARMGFTRKRGL
jgi:transposase